MRRSLLLVLSVSSVLGCPSPSSQVVTASIGPAGGTLEHPLGTKLVVPAGALASAVELSIGAKSAPDTASLGATPLGSAFVLGPDGQQFLAPVQVVLPYDAAQLPAGVTAASLEIRISPQDVANFAALASTVDEVAHRVTASTTHFSVVVVSAPGTAGACSGLQNNAPIVSETQVAQAGPNPTGGSIATGVYFRTATVLYTGVGGSSGLTGKQRQQVLRIVSTSPTAVTIEGVERDVNRAQEERYAGTAVLSGNNFTVTRTCPSADTQTLSYRFAADAFEVIEPDGAATRVTTFTRQASLDAGVDDGGVAGECASVQRTGPLVDEYRVAASPPTPAGGALLSGTFVRVADTVYTGVGGPTGWAGEQRQQTIALVASSGADALVEESFRSGTDPEELRAYSLTTAGTQFVLSLTCPVNVGQKTLGYTLANEELHVFETVSSGLRVSTFVMLGADGGLPSYDAGVVSPPDAGAQVQVLASGLSDLVDLDLDATDVYTLGAGEVRRCALGGCGTSATLVTSAFASSLAVDQGLLWATTNYRTLHTCPVSGACTLVQQADLGANTYPAHLWAANGRVYWISESGTSRRIQVCLSGGCTSGYPKTVFQGAALDGLAVTGLVVNATDAYVTSFTGGVYRVPLTDAETATATGAGMTVGSGYGTGGLDGDAALLRWANVNSGALESCVLPGCTVVVPFASGLASPSGVRSDATHLYGINRGTPNGSGGFVAGTATVWRMPR